MKDEPEKDVPRRNTMDTLPVVNISLHLQASLRFPVHLTQQPAKTAVLTGLEVQLWHPSFPSRSHSRAAGQAPPAPQEEGDDKVEASQRGGEEGAVTME